MTMNFKINLKYYSQHDFDYCNITVSGNGLNLTFGLTPWDIETILNLKPVHRKYERIQLTIDPIKDTFYFKSSVNGGEYGCCCDSSTYYPIFDLETKGGQQIYNELRNEFSKLKNKWSSELSESESSESESSELESKITLPSISHKKPLKQKTETPLSCLQKIKRKR